MRHVRPTRVCRNCGVAFKPKRTERVTFCSRECSFAFKAAVPKAPPAQKPCLMCGATCPPKHTYCGDECRKESARRKARAYGERKHQGKTCVCRVCGVSFHPTYATKKRACCSVACANEAARQDIRNSKQMRRARKKGAFVDAVYRQRIFERDGWRCRICGGRVKRDACAPHPMAPTLDHIVPLAKGGTHEPRNVQLAHSMCNSMKGDGSAGEQLLLVG